MKMEIIQPFINAADAVLGETLRCSARVEDLSMDSVFYQRHGIAASVLLNGDIEGRVILDLQADTVRKMAEEIGSAEEASAMVNEVVCELANQVIGNAITVLNDSGYHFQVQPPQVTASDQVPMSTVDTETLVMKFETGGGPVFLNIALRARRDFDAD